jgi:hypothetical protein
MGVGHIYSHGQTAVVPATCATVTTQIPDITMDASSMDEDVLDTRIPDQHGGSDSEDIELGSDDRSSEDDWTSTEEWEDSDELSEVEEEDIYAHHLREPF